MIYIYVLNISILVHYIDVIILYRTISDKVPTIKRNIAFIVFLITQSIPQVS